MEDGHDDQSCCGCKQIFCCIFRTSRTHHSSPQTQDQPPPFSVPTNEDNYKPRFEPQAKPQRNAVDFERHVQRQGSRSGSDVNKAFSDYISQGKVKIRAMSNAGTDDVEIVYSKADEVCDRNSGKKTDANDMFVDYINRAKKTIRKTSSLGSKSMISFGK